MVSKPMPLLRLQCSEGMEGSARVLPGVQSPSWGGADVWAGADSEYSSAEGWS